MCMVFDWVGWIDLEADVMNARPGTYTVPTKRETRGSQVHMRRVLFSTGIGDVAKSESIWFQTLLI